MHITRSLTVAAAAAAIALPALAQQQRGQQSQQDQQGWYQYGQNQDDQTRYGQGQWQQDGSQQNTYRSQRSGQHQGDQAWTRQGQQDRSLQQSQEGTRFRGELQGVRTAQLQGYDEDHLLAKIRLDDGRTIVADLGPVSNLRNQQARLRRGQQIQATGRTGTLDGQPIIVLDRLVGDGQFIVIAPDARQTDQAGTRQQDTGRMQMDRQQMQQRRNQMMQSRQHMMAQQQDPQAQRGQQQYAFPDQQQRSRQGQQMFSQTAVLLQGQIEDLRDMTFTGQDEAHRIAKVKIGQDETIVVDLGQGKKLKDVTLEKGEWIMVIGTPGRVNGRPVVFADAIADMVTIDRPQPKSNQQPSSQKGQDQSSQQEQRAQEASQSRSGSSQQRDQQQRQQNRESDQSN